MFRSNLKAMILPRRFVQFERDPLHCYQSSPRRDDNSTGQVSNGAPGCSWSNRILIAAVVGILFLTLYPFCFYQHKKLPQTVSPFLLGTSDKSVKPHIIFLNIFLFVPLGLGLGAKLRERGKSWQLILTATGIAGIVLSYAIELAQIYIPPRDSGWEDVFTNSAGSFLGGCLFLLVGSQLFQFLSRWEASFEAWLSPARVVPALGLYFGLWLFVSVYLQQQTRLEDWDPACFLMLGNDATGRYPWKGKLSRLQIWDRPLTMQYAKALKPDNQVSAAEANLLADFAFSTPAPYRDQKRFLPSLNWTPLAPPFAMPEEVILDGTACITSSGEVRELVRRVQQTNQFAVRLVLELTETDISESSIFSISQSSGLVDVELHQTATELVFWFRNPLSERRAYLAWHIPTVLSTNEQHDLMFSYDGSVLSLFLDGRKEYNSYRLSPGAALATLLRRIKPIELEGYADIYYAVVFFPLGILIGTEARRTAMPTVGTFSVLLITLSLTPFVLELVLVCVSGRPLSLQNLALSFFLVLAGYLWVNTDASHNQICSLRL
jgi:VanZ family protein